MKLALPWLVFFALPFLAIPQSEKPGFALPTDKGVTPLSPAHPLTRSLSATRAVVVGISDYQNPVIPDLRFADKDAEAFANWLRSPAGGSLPETNIQVLLNSEATTGKIIAAIGGLVSDCRPGDVAIIYFSGHGDVERISKYQRGYWLTWDSPPAVYAAGACALGYLQDIISTLSESGVQVVVVADACRAGKLAGSAVGGAQATTAALAQQFANEVKILSCQPEEYSLEGEQWGGGRGAFSFHLVDALYGLADANSDGTVILLELGRYLEDKVPAETAPHSQIPFTVGGKATPIAHVHAGALAQWKKQKAGAVPAFNKIDSKGLEELALAGADSSVQALYRKFLTALDRGDLMEVPDGSRRTANDLYNLLMKEPALSNLHGLMTRNFAAALMDEGQQILNRFLSGDLQAFEILENEIGINHRLLADQFYRAAELLGENHYYYASTKAKGLYFESYAVYHLDIPRDSARMLDKKLMRQAAAVDSTAAHVWLNLCWVELSPDSIAYYIERLENLAPNWPIYHIIAAKVYNAVDPNNPDKALLHYQRAIALDSTFIPAWFGVQKPLTRLGRKDEADRCQQTAVRIGLKKVETTPHLMAYEEWRILANNLFELERMAEFERVCSAYLAVDSISLDRLISYAYLMKSYTRYAEAEQAFRKMFALDSSNIKGWNGLGWLFFDQRRYTEMEQVYRKCTALAPNNDACWNGLGWALLKQSKYTEAESAFLKCLDLGKRSLAAWNGLGQLYHGQKRYEEAEKARRKYIEIAPTVGYGWTSLGQVLQDVKRYPEAEAAYRKAIELDSTDYNVWRDLGSFFYNTQRNTEAETAYRKATVLDSTSVLNWNSLSLALNRLSRYAEAELAMLKAIALDSTNATVWNNFGNVYFATRRYAEAELVLKKAIALDSTNSIFYKNLCNLYLNTSHYAEAEPIFKKSIELDSTNSILYNNLGFTYLKLGRYAEAEQILKKGIALDSTIANGHKHLATLHFRTGRREEARAGFEKALELNPEYIGGYLGMAYLLAADSKTAEALGYVEQAIGKGATMEQLEKDEDLAPLRTLPEWKTLMKKHFPDQTKD